MDMCTLVWDRSESWTELIYLLLGTHPSSHFEKKITIVIQLKRQFTYTIINIYIIFLPFGETTSVSIITDCKGR